MTTPLSLLRAWMRQQDIGAFLVPMTDPHASEYIDDHWKNIAWLTGFTGSAATVVVTLQRAALWTDSRYFIQAQQELSGRGMELMKMGMKDTPSIEEWVAQEDAHLIVYATAATAIYRDIQLAHFSTIDADPFATIVPARPPLTLLPIEAYPLAHAGERSVDKLQRLRSTLSEEERKEAYAFVLNDLNSIAWLLNLRGSDIPYNPVFHAFLVVLPEGGVLCCNPERLTKEAAAAIEEAQITPAAYDDLFPILNVLHDSTLCWYLADTISYGIRQHLLDKGCDVRPIASSLEALRAVKNAAEIEGFRRSMLRDGVAMVRFLRWLEAQQESGALASLTEVDIDRRLTAFRAQSPEFRGLSFETIAGYAANGAIVHYTAEEKSAARLSARSFLLLDSGAHYTDGTTDITRTLPLGDLTEEERTAYTLVLKGHLQLSHLHFPEGTNGNQLDTAARMAMWKEGYDYGHGTGHGVGAYLSVHEGPQQIRKDVRPATLLPFEEGMTVSNEPGIYVEGHFGVRIENVLLVRRAATTPFGSFLCFEDLTLCPIDTTAIRWELMTAEERTWLNDYHQQVYDRLSPHLSVEEAAWLAAKTKAC